MKIKFLVLTAVLISLLGCREETGDRAEMVLTTKTFPLDNIDNLFFTNDNGLLISGSSDGKYTFIRTDASLNIKWTQNGYDWGTFISGSGWGSAFYSVRIVKVFQKNDGKYVCVGTISEGGDVVYSSALIVVLNQNGEQVQKYKLEDMAVTNALQTDDGYILSGSRIIKLDKNFHKLWTKSAGDNQYSPNQIVSSSNGGFAVTGSYNGDQIFLKKFNAEGKELLCKTYKHNESPFEESGFDLVRLEDNGFLIVGRSGRTFVPNVIDCQIIRTNAAGDTIWTKRLGYSASSWLDHIISSHENEFTLQGNIGFPVENQKSVLMRVNSAGELLDSISTEKFLMITCSPFNQYLMAQREDSAHIGVRITDNPFDKE